MSNADRVHIDLERQCMTLYAGCEEIAEYPVSTARNGPGELRDSGCTPQGTHKIRIKIGADAPENTVFVARRPTGEIYTPELGRRYPERDWILTRILWLVGQETGKNRGGDRDTQRRFIYIHGCPDSEPMGVPLSHGCIRMRNRDVMSFFDKVDSTTIIQIE